MKIITFEFHVKSITFEFHVKNISLFSSTLIRNLVSQARFKKVPNILLFASISQYFLQCRDPDIRPYTLQGPELLETSWQDLEILGNVSIVRIIALAAKVAET